MVKEVFDDLAYYEFIGDYTLKVFKNKKGGMFYSYILEETDDDAKVIQEFKYFNSMNEAKQKALNYIKDLKKKKK